MNVNEIIQYWLSRRMLEGISIAQRSGNPNNLVFGKCCCCQKTCRLDQIVHKSCKAKIGAIFKRLHKQASRITELPSPSFLDD